MNYLIWGATGSIGSEVARLLVESGNQVALVGRSKEKLDALSSELQMPAILQSDIQFENFEQTMIHLKDHFNEIHGVANCIGSLELKPAHLTSEEEWSYVLHANLGTCFGILRSVARSIMKSKGSIVFVSSAAARHGIANHDAIGAAKAGILGLVISSAATYAHYGVRVNAVAPGMVDSSLTKNLLMSESAKQASESLHPLKKIGHPRDIARMIEWLLRPEQQWVTGQVFGVDGGLSTVRSRDLIASKREV